MHIFIYAGLKHVRKKYFFNTSSHQHLCNVKRMGERGKKKKKKKTSQIFTL